MQELIYPDSQKKFKDWLAETGVEVQEPKIWEVIRFKVGKDVGIIYHNKSNVVTTATPMAEQAYSHWKMGKLWLPMTTERRQSTERRNKLYNKVGGECFFCGEHFDRPETTLEHLLPLSHGGPNNHHNYALACGPCNKEAGSLPLIDKIKLRDQKRASKIVVEKKINIFRRLFK